MLGLARDLKLLARLLLNCTPLSPITITNFFLLGWIDIESRGNYEINCVSSEQNKLYLTDSNFYSFHTSIMLNGLF